MSPWYPTPHKEVDTRPSKRLCATKRNFCGCLAAESFKCRCDSSDSRATDTGTLVHGLRVCDGLLGEASCLSQGPWDTTGQTGDVDVLLRTRPACRTPSMRSSAPRAATPSVRPLRLRLTMSPKPSRRNGEGLPTGRGKGLGAHSDAPRISLNGSTPHPCSRCPSLHVPVALTSHAPALCYCELCPF